MKPKETLNSADNLIAQSTASAAREALPSVNLRRLFCIEVAWDLSAPSPNNIRTLLDSVFQHQLSKCLIRPSSHVTKRIPDKRGGVTHLTENFDVIQFEWPKATPIELESYPRKDLYKHFLTFEIPVVTRTIQIDVTELLAHAKSRKLRFSLTLGFVLTRGTNHVPELRHRILHDELVTYDRIIPSFTILGPDKRIFFSKGVFSDNFADDYPSNLAIIDRAAQGLEPNMGSDNQGQVFITNNPWNTFTSLTFPYARRVASMPVFGIGKMYVSGGRTMAPLAMQTHHGLTDGYHIGHFLDIMQRHLEDPGLIDRPFISNYA